MLAGAPDEVTAPGVSKTGGPPYVFRSAPIPVGYLRADCWEWKQGISGSLSYSRSLMAAREVAILLSGDRALSVPSGFDHVWTITSDQASRQAVLQKVSAERGMDPAPSSSSSPPSRRLWQNCLRFTVQARLAPQWNKVGQYLVRGRDFLSVENGLWWEAVKPELRSVASNAGLLPDYESVLILLEPLVIRSARVTLESLGVNPEVLERFATGQIDKISGSHFAAKHLTALPNLGRGRLMSITKELIKSEDIRNYADMRRYWKNRYGYRLPKEEADVSFYCNLVFNGFIPEGCDSSLDLQYCYPDVCVRLDRPEPVLRMRRDHDPVLTVRRFMEDMKVKVPDICGTPLDFRLQHRGEGDGSVSGYFSFKAALHKSASNGDQSCLIPITANEGWPNENKASACGNRIRNEVNLNSARDQSGCRATTTIIADCSSSSPSEPPKKKVKPTFSSAPGTLRKNFPLLETGEGGLQRRPVITDFFCSAKVNPAIKVATADPVKDQRRIGMGFPKICKKEDSSIKASTKDTKVKDVDVRSLAVTNQLHKATTPTLVAWLRSEGVNCLAKDKKAILVAKVLEHLGLLNQHLHPLPQLPLAGEGTLRPREP